jgi:hypothetical protein
MGERFQDILRRIKNHAKKTQAKFDEMVAKEKAKQAEQAAARQRKRAAKQRDRNKKIKELKQQLRDLEEENAAEGGEANGPGPSQSAAGVLTGSAAEISSTVEATASGTRKADGQGKRNEQDETHTVRSMYDKGKGKIHAGLGKLKPSN